MPTHAAYLTHESWAMPRFYLADSAEAAEAKATAALLEWTADDRDHDEFPTDQDWLDCCLSEGWVIEAGEVCQ